MICEFLDFSIWLLYFLPQLTAEKIVIGKTGKVTGNIKAQSAQVMGSLSGDVTVSNTLTIHSEGSIAGKVAYKMLDIKLGGQIKGDIQAIGATPISAPQQNKATGMIFLSVIIEASLGMFSRSLSMTIWFNYTDYCHK